MRKSQSSKKWKKEQNKAPKNIPSLEASLPSIQSKKNIVENSHIQANNVMIGDISNKNVTITTIINTPYVFDFTMELNQQDIPDYYVERHLKIEEYRTILFNEIWEQALPVIEEKSTDENEMFLNTNAFAKQKSLDEISEDKFGEPKKNEVNTNTSKKILILGEAGSGKTTFLENSCKLLNKHGNCAVLFKKLKKDIRLENDYTIKLHPSKECILVLDGLDEVDIPQAEDFILRHINSCPNLNIVVSCRSVHFRNDISQLKSFDRYTLSGFGHGEMVSYLQNRLGENDNDFWEKCRQKNIFGWYQSSYNPFIIKVLCDYYLSHNHRIDDLEEAYDYMVEEALKIRKKDSSGVDLTTEIERKELKKLLSKVAFILQVQHKNSLSDEDFKAVVGNVQMAEDLLNFTSIIEKNNSEWVFGEVKIQEFLAAKVLSEVKYFQTLKSIVSADSKFLKNSWANVATLFYAIKGGNQTVKADFLAWLETDNLNVLMNLEQDVISNSDRFWIFKNFIQKCRNSKQEPYEILGSSIWELSGFINNSTEILDWICNELAHENSFSILHLFAMILVDTKDFSFLENQQRKIKTKFLPFFEDFPTKKLPDTFAEALIICKSIMSKEEWIKVCHSLFNENGSHSRDAAYKIILKFGLQDDLAEHLIAPFLSTFQKKDNDVIDINEKDNLKKCISSINREDIILKLLSMFEDENQLKTIEFSDKLLPLILNAVTKLRTRSNELNEKLVRVIIKNLYFFNIKEDLQNKLQELDLLDKLIYDTIFQGSSLYLIRQFYETHFTKINANYFAENFRKPNPEEKDWTNLLGWINTCDTTKAEEISNIIGVSVPPLPQTIQPLSEDFKRKVLFDKATSMTETQQIIEELRVIHKKDILTKDDNKHARRDGLYDKYTHFNLFSITRNDYIDLNEVYDYLDTNWEWRSISEIKNRTISDKLELSQKEISFVKNWCDDYIYKRHPDKNTRTHGLDTVAFFTVKYDFKHYNPEIYEMLLRLSEIMPIGEKTILQLINKAKLLPEQKVKEIVLSDLSEIEGHTSFLEEYLYFLNYKRYKDALPLLLAILEKETYQDWDKTFEVAVKFGAANEQLFNIWNNLPKDNIYRESLLYKHLIIRCKQQTVDFLKNRLQSDETKNNAILFLVQTGEIVALQEILSLYKEQKLEDIPYFHDLRASEKWAYNTPETIPFLVGILLYSTIVKEEHRFTPYSNFFPAYNALFRLGIIENGKYITVIEKELNRNIALTKRLNLFSKIAYFKNKYAQKYKWYNEKALSNVEKIKKEFLYYATQNKTYSLAESIRQYDSVKNGHGLKAIVRTFDGEHKISIPIIPLIWTYYISSKTNLKDVFGNMWKEFKIGEIFFKK